MSTYCYAAIAERIKQTAKNNKVSIKQMLNDLGMGINLISHLAKGQNISSISLAQIADYLNCSVDYLLGRTDNLIENPSSLTVDSTTYQILTISQSLPEAQKEELLSFARYLKEKQSL